jgi:hypothetical protein
LTGTPAGVRGLFSTAGADWRLNAALMHGYGDRWLAYAIGYKRAADILVSSVAETGRHQDVLVYPVVFLYRQYLELTLKNLIRKSRMLLDDGHANDDLDSHDLRKYWEITHKLLVRLADGKASRRLVRVERLIDELCRHDPASFSFRYPVSKPNRVTRRRAPTLAALRMINLGRVQMHVRSSAELLDGAIAFVDDRLDAKFDTTR